MMPYIIGFILGSAATQIILAFIFGKKIESDRELIATLQFERNKYEALCRLNNIIAPNPEGE